LNSLDIHEILKYLPHRYPFLLVDRVLTYTKDESITAIKNVTINEPFFQGHFPNRPVMPGVLIIEAMAQSCAILSFKSMGALPKANAIFYFVGIDNARFKRPVEPGDQLRLTSKIKRKVKGIWMFESSAHVGDELCCSADLMCTYKEG
jgi:3-hydroxyacyl-[acyl-carrier-protein] dehydratase